MRSFNLTIVCPDGTLYDGPAEFIKLRTTAGDVGILAHHTRYAAAIGMGECEVQIGDVRRKASCIGGMITVADNEVDVVCTTFEWKEDIDLDRAKRALEKSQARLAAGGLSDADRRIVEAKLRRAKVRIAVAESK